VPEVVRNNLGITFAKVERRKIAQTLRVPGRFEYTPEAVHSYPALLEGRVELLVGQFTQVEQGELLFKLDAPGWRERQAELDALHTRIEAARANLAARESVIVETQASLEAVSAGLATVKELAEVIEKHSVLLREAEKVWEERLVVLEEMSRNGVGKAADLTEARSKLVDARAKFTEESEKHIELELRQSELMAEQKRLQAAKPRQEAELVAVRFELEAALAATAFAMTQTAVLTGFTEQSLAEIDQGKPRWRRLQQLEIRARSKGVVARLNVSGGAWVGLGAEVLSVVDPAKVRVHARMMQADMLRVANGHGARILPPAGGTLSYEAPLEGKVAVGLTGDADERVIDLFVTPEKTLGWARPGVAVEVEITLASTDEAVFAMPVHCAVRDELERVFFRRDPNNADKVIRIAGEFGISDGRWIHVKAGVIEGDEIVLGGVYELKLTGSGKATAGGHFHADGTYHPGDD